MCLRSICSSCRTRNSINRRSYKYKWFSKGTRVDGNVFELNTGDPVFQGDTIETSVDGSVGLVFIKQLSLSEGGKMVLVSWSMIHNWEWKYVARNVRGALVL